MLSLAKSARENNLWLLQTSTQRADTITLIIKPNSSLNIFRQIRVAIRHICEI